MIVISVIIPCFNCSEKITDCLLGLESQTFRDFEIIFIDDNSKDETFRIIDAFSKTSKLKTAIIRNSFNIGPSLSRKKGIEMSKGQYVSFIDADDAFDSSLFEKLLFSIQATGSDISFCDYYFISTSGKKVKRNRGYSDVVVNLENKITLNIDSLWGMLIKKDLFNNISFPDLRNGEDMAILPQLFVKANTLSYVKECLYYYKYYGNSLSNVDTPLRLDSLKASLNCIKQTITNYPTEIEYLAIRNYLYPSLLIFYSTKKRSALFKSLISSFESEYKRWNKNKYIHTLSLYKRAILCLAKKRLIFLMKIMFAIRTGIINK